MAGVPWNLKNKNKDNKKICSQSAVPEDTVGAEALERCNPCKSHGFSKKGKTASAVLLSSTAHTHGYLVLEVLTIFFAVQHHGRGQKETSDNTWTKWKSKRSYGSAITSRSIHVSDQAKQPTGTGAEVMLVSWECNFLLFWKFYCSSDIRGKQATPFLALWHCPW